MEISRKQLDSLLKIDKQTTIIIYTCFQSLLFYHKGFEKYDDLCWFLFLKHDFSFIM